MLGSECIKHFDQWSLSAGLLLPTIGIFWDVPDDQLANAYCRAYNNWVYDFQAADRNRLVIAPQMPYVLRKKLVALIQQWVGT